MPNAARPLTSTTRLIVRVLQGILAGEPELPTADLKEALKCRLARLRIPYDATSISAALDRVEGQRRRLAPKAKPRLVERPVEGEIISKADAAALLKWLGISL